MENENHHNVQKAIRNYKNGFSLEAPEYIRRFYKKVFTNNGESFHYLLEPGKEVSDEFITIFYSATPTFINTVSLEINKSRAPHLYGIDSNGEATPINLTSSRRLETGRVLTYKCDKSYSEIKIRIFSPIGVPTKFSLQGLTPDKFNEAIKDINGHLMSIPPEYIELEAEIGRQRFKKEKGLRIRS